MVTKDYSKSRMRENCTYGSVRGGQSNLIPSTRLTAALPLRVQAPVARSGSGPGRCFQVFPKVDTPYGQAPLGLEGSKV